MKSGEKGVVSGQGFVPEGGKNIGALQNRYSTLEKQSQPENISEKERILSPEKFPTPKEHQQRLIDLGLEEHAKAYEKVVALVAAINEAGGEALLIGGCVRDTIFNKVSKDYDIEVYGLPAEKVAEIVHAHGKVNEVGAAFGILKLDFGAGVDADVSLPRSDSKTGEGHAGFDVKTDPSMSIADAALRRDFTMNTVAANPITGDIYDPHGGVEDIKNRLLRITDRELFADDPLRVMRAIQFIGRFGLEIEPESMQIMQEMVSRLREISKERFWEEWKKLFLKSEKPSLGLSAAMTLGVMREMYPQFVEMREGQNTGEFADVDKWIHTLMSVDEVAKIVKRENLPGKEAFAIMLTTLCSNLVRGDITGGRKSEKKQKVDVAPVSKFLKSVNSDNKTRDIVLSLITSRAIPGQMFVEDQVRGSLVTDGQIRRLAEKIHPATIRQLVLLAEADHLGGGAFGEEVNKEALLMPTDSFPARDWLLERASELGIDQGPPGELIQGRDLIAFGLDPKSIPKKQRWCFGKIIALATDLRDEKRFTSEKFFQEIDGLIDPEEIIKKLTQLLHA